MARTLLINQLDKLIVELEKEYNHYITCAKEVKSKIEILKATKEIAGGKSNKVSQKRKYTLMFKRPLKSLLSQVLKESIEEYRSTVDITGRMLILDEQPEVLKTDERYITPVKRALKALIKQDIVLMDIKGTQPETIFWKLKT